ncbi:2-hydroxyacyl-CoA dehydratase subunit D [Intestinimonas sp.]|uniref:2-hydroxyacyl-CoA dehydratase subunit D n=1 Tax=Intestinimonas sp. TaxID=1965293 RepID=UPI00260C564A|nr:2-hydroxyacyl-CoA dehydratase family protein [Intestinimonas sp.]
MSIRDCAMQSKAFAALKDVYDHRDAEAAKWRAAGKKVIGELGCDVPDELIMAGGMLPVQICADPNRPLVETDKYLEYAFDPAVRAQFEKIVDGTYYDQLDALAISNSTDVIIRVFLYLREIHRVEPEKKVPPVAFIDWLFTRHRIHQTRDEFVIELFRQQVEEWAGRSISDEEIRAAARICNENRQALREMAWLRHGAEVRIGGSEALVIIGAGLFMDRAEHTRLVRQVTEDARSWPVLAGPRVFYTGANQEDTVLYEKMEAAGLVVVGEDTDWGDRFYDRDFNLDYPVIRAIVDRYLLREFSAKKSTPAQRKEALDREVDAVNAQGVVFYTNQYDEVATWDMPKQCKSLESRGIKHITFGRMLWPVAKNEDLDDKLAGFAAELKGGVR